MLTYIILLISGMIIGAVLLGIWIEWHMKDFMG
jgi:hypothetical protein